MKVRFVTTNAGKFREARAMLEPAGIALERVDRPYPEVQADRLADVVAFAAEGLAEQVEPPWLIDDSGLFVDALRGFPGAYSSYVFRTIGPRGILRLLRGSTTRAARFETAFLYHDGTSPLAFRGRCRGTIAQAERGSGGFGFDPIFMPSGSTKTFGEMSVAEKNRLSHRAQAAAALVAFLADPGRMARRDGT